MKLSPCPFCGYANGPASELIQFRHKGDGKNGPGAPIHGCYYECGECGAQGPWEPFYSDGGEKDKAAKLVAKGGWNMRLARTR